MSTKPNIGMDRRTAILYEGSGSDDVTRGRHDWRHADEQTWVEHLPRGEENKMVVIGRFNLQNATGTLLQNSEHTSWEFFIPDKGSESMRVQMRVDKGAWFVIADMLDVQ